MGTAVLVLFNFNLLDHVFVPCIVCSSAPKKLESDFSLLKIKSLWFALNNNFHRKILIISRAVRGHQCNEREVNVANLMYFDKCKIIKLLKRRI